MQAPKEDPKEKERNKTRTWISEKLEILSTQKDAYEVEIETLNSSKKKNKKDTSASRHASLRACRKSRLRHPVKHTFSACRFNVSRVYRLCRWEDLIERCRFHEEKLEIVRERYKPANGTLSRTRAHPGA